MTQRKIAEALLDAKAVTVTDTDNLFTWVSGIKSPIYCDNRITISYPAIRKMIAEAFVAKIKEQCPDVEVIAGTATAGIPHAAWVADLLELPMIYVRSKPKEHGASKQIEGVLTEGQKVVVIEDLFSTGKSSVGAVKAVQAEGGNVIKVLGIFSYGFKVLEEAFEGVGTTHESLSNYQTLLEVALERNVFDEKQLPLLKKWSEDPRMFTK